jgi:hypothetical protein
VCVELVCEHLENFELLDCVGQAVCPLKGQPHHQLSCKTTPEDHDDHEGGLSEAGIKFTDDTKVFPSQNHLEYRSAQVDQTVLVSVSSKWSLTYCWSD